MASSGNAKAGGPENPPVRAHVNKPARPWETIILSLNALRGLALQVVPFGERISTPRIRGTSFLVPHFTPEPHHCYESRGTDNPLGTVPSSAGVTSRGGLRVPESWNQPPHKGGKRRVL